jgi:DNA-binding CsgD family transcriptional regulator
VILTPKHFSITSASDVLSVTGPLFKTTRFNYFSYFKEFVDGSRALLSTDPDWTYFLYGRTYATITNFQPKLESARVENDKTGNFLWEWLPNLLPSSKLKLQFYDKMRDSQSFNINNGISIIRKVCDGHEYFNFGTSDSASYIYKFYFNHIDLLNRFVVYFKIQAESLLSGSVDHKIFIPKGLSAVNELDSAPDDVKLEQFLSQTQLKKYPVKNLQCQAYISHRQLQCLYYVSHGYSAKEIAQELDISHRTVEKHIQLLKEDFSLSTKSDLLKFSSRSDIEEYFGML